MSLLGESLYQGKRSPAPGMTALKLTVESNSGLASGIAVIGYTGSILYVDATDNIIVIDLPTTFNNLQSVLTNPQAKPGAAMMLYAIGTIFTPSGVVADNLGNVVFFPKPPPAGFPPLDPQYSRIWFLCQKTDVDNTTFLPTNSLIYLELGIANTSVVGVAP